MQTTSGTLTQMVVNAWTNWRRQRANVAELGRLGPEIDDMARDLGLPSDVLITLAAKGPDAADLLVRRMEVIGLDPKAIGEANRAILRDLQVCCSRCGNKSECANDLENRPKEQDWRGYCPNSDTLAALEQGQCHRDQAATKTGV